MAKSNYDCCAHCDAKCVYIGEDEHHDCLVFCNDACAIAYVEKRRSGSVSGTTATTPIAWAVLDGDGVAMEMFSIGKLNPGVAEKLARECCHGYNKYKPDCAPYTVKPLFAGPSDTTLPNGMVKLWDPLPDSDGGQ